MTIAVIQTHEATDGHSWYGQDALLNLASLDLNPQLIVIAEAVKHLCHGADVQRQQRSLQKRYRLLQLYDCPKPWVIDTDMQQEIRAVNEDKFSSVAMFWDKKNKGELSSVESTATKLFTLLNRSFEGEIFQELKNI